MEMEKRFGDLEMMESQQQQQQHEAVVGSSNVANMPGGVGPRDADEKRLNELGYKQEYRRLMTPFQQWAYTFSYTAPLGFITGYYGFMYSYGGPVTIIWGYLATTFGTLCMAFGMSEVVHNKRNKSQLSIFFFPLLIVGGILGNGGMGLWWIWSPSTCTHCLKSTGCNWVNAEFMRISGVFSL
jgi:hypothetical protein